MYWKETTILFTVYVLKKNIDLKRVIKAMFYGQIPGLYKYVNITLN